MTTDEKGFNPAARRLCPDGSCLGILGADGRCNVCKRDGGAAAADPIIDAAPELDGDLLAEDGEDAEVAAEAGGAAGDAPAPGDFDPARRLCEDGACVGIVGANGACSVCGRVAS